MQDLYDIDVAISSTMQPQSPYWHRRYIGTTHAINIIMTTTTKETMMSDAQRQAAGKVATLATASEWRDRVYLNPKASVRNYRGCQTSKLWIDTDGELHYHSGKGTTPSAYDEQVEAIREILA